tara:strand:- start:1581 stop:1994 length:414 start_codon:yes stop_codon:yes gene_type:complete
MVSNSGFVLECTATVAASDAAGTIDVVNMQTDSTVASVTELFVPVTENWVFTDAYILAAADAGTSSPSIRFDKNRGRSMGTTPPLSALLVSNNTRPRFLPSSIGFEAGSIVRMFSNTSIANDATADAIKFFVAVSIQ